MRCFTGCRRSRTSSKASGLLLIFALLSLACPAGYGSEKDVSDPPRPESFKGAAQGSGLPLQATTITFGGQHVLTTFVDSVTAM